MTLSQSHDNFLDVVMQGSSFISIIFQRCYGKWSVASRPSTFLTRSFLRVPKNFGAKAWLGIICKLRLINWSPLCSGTRLCLFPKTRNGHSWVPSPSWYMMKDLGGYADGPIRRGMTLFSTYEITGLVVFYAWPLISPCVFPHILDTLDYEIGGLPQDNWLYEWQATNCTSNYYLKLGGESFAFIMECAKFTSIFPWHHTNLGQKMFKVVKADYHEFWDWLKWLRKNSYILLRDLIICT